MPLLKSASKKAVSENIRREMAAAKAAQFFAAAREGVRRGEEEKKRRFRKLKDGQWSTWVKVRKDYGYMHKLKCCACGLVHLVQYEVTAKGLRFRAWRQKK